MANLFDEFGIDYKKPKQKESSTLKNIADLLGGGVTGLAQGASDIGANIAQFPSDVYSYFTGKPGYTAPKPDLREYAPSSPIGQFSEKAGEFAAPFLSPGMAAETVLGKAMYGGRLLPRLITDALLGSAESENRKLGAGFGLATPALGKIGRYIKETPFTEKGATKNLNKALNIASKQETHNIPINIDMLRNLEYQMGSKTLAPAKIQLNTLLGNAAKGDYSSYFKLQSALGDVARDLKTPTAKGIMGWLASPQSTAVERIAARQIDDIRNQYISDALKHLKETGHGKLASLSRKGQEDYAKYMGFKDTRNNILKSLLKGGVVGGVGIPGYEILKHLL